MIIRWSILALAAFALTACGHGSDGGGNVQRSGRDGGVETVVREYLEAHALDPDGTVFCAIDLFGGDNESANRRRAFVLYACSDWTKRKRGLENTQGEIVPAVFHLAKKDGSWRVERVEEPRDGADYGPDMKRLFPDATRAAIEKASGCKLDRETLAAARRSFDAPDEPVIEPDACLDKDPTT